MVDPLQLNLLRKEVELTSYFGTIVTEDFEDALNTPDDHDTELVLLLALIGNASKLSRLLWRYGRRVTDTTDRAEAESLRAQLGVDDDSPLAPERITPLTAVLGMPINDLAEAWKRWTREIEVNGKTYPVQPVVDEIRQVHHAVSGR